LAISLAVCWRARRPTARHFHSNRVGLVPFSGDL
jgi:hypothetical protein